MYRILSIDGGGIKGIISAYVLAELEDVIRKRSGNEKASIAEYFDLIAGTSTGAILALMLLCPDGNGNAKYSANDCVKMYNMYGGEIFRRSFFRKIYTLGGLLGAKYPSKNIEKVLKNNFNDIRMTQLLKPCLITAYDMTGRKCVFFNKEDGKKDKRRDFFVVDAARASCAAPTYFPPHKMQRCDGTYGLLCDGGVFANNATMCAIAEAAKMQGCTSEMAVLSVGNAVEDAVGFEDDGKGWGIIKWGRPIIDILLSSSMQTVDYQMRKIFTSCEKKGNYLRVNATCVEEECLKMDDASERAIKKLNELGWTLAKKSRKSLEIFAERLI